MARTKRPKRSVEQQNSTKSISRKKPKQSQNGENPNYPSASSSKICELSANFVPDDVTKLLTAFPEEIWLIILAKLHSADDFAAISNSSQFFRQRFLPKRVLFLFPQVWKVLAIQYETKTNPVYEEDQQKRILKKYRRTSGNMRKIRPFSVILKLRQVCKTWCDGIDAFYQNMETNYRMEQDAIRPLPIDCKWETEDCEVLHKIDMCWTKRYFMNEQTIRAFGPHFDKSHLGQKKRSPFLTNEAEIFMGFDLGGRHTNILNRFLKNYGEHIWHCILDLDQKAGFSMSETYMKLQMVLNFMPNLVTLKIQYFVVEYGLCLKRTENGHIQREIQENPMPTLKRLKYLRAEKLPTEFVDELVNQNRHIEMLEVVSEDKYAAWNILSEEMPNLKQLSLHVKCLAELQDLRCTMWQLKKVYLNLKHSKYIRWSSTFETVELLGKDTATEIMLGLPSSKTKTEMEQHIAEHDKLKLNMPHVKRLRIDLGNHTSLDFILPTKNSLKSLEISEEFNERKFPKMWRATGFFKTVKRNSVIKYPGGNNNGVRNVWKIFPKLEEIQYLNGPLYTRK